MKRTILFELTAFCLLAFLTSGCMSNNAFKHCAPLNLEADLELLPDITIGERIEGEGTMITILGFISLNSMGIGDHKFADGVIYGLGGSGSLIFEDILGGDGERAKAAAARKACDSAGCDIIIAPRYNLDVKNFLVYKMTKARVTGIAGTLNNVSVEGKASRSKAEPKSKPAPETTTPRRSTRRRR